MADPGELLAVERLLSAGPAKGTSDAQLRRAVATAYYALFYTVLRAAADSFVGSGRAATAAYNLLYRGLAHGRVKSICEILGAGTLGPNAQRQLARTAVSTDVKDLALPSRPSRRFGQERTTIPRPILLRLDVMDIVDAAERAMQAFARIPPDERADILALMLVNPRD